MILFYTKIVNILESSVSDHKENTLPDIFYSDVSDSLKVGLYYLSVCPIVLKNDDKLINTKWEKFSEFLKVERSENFIKSIFTSLWKYYTFNNIKIVNDTSIKLSPSGWEFVLRNGFININNYKFLENDLITDAYASFLKIDNPYYIPKFNYEFLHNEQNLFGNPKIYKFICENYYLTESELIDNLGAPFNYSLNAYSFMKSNLSDKIFDYNFSYEYFYPIFNLEKYEEYENNIKNEIPIVYMKDDYFYLNDNQIDIYDKSKNKFITQDKFFFTSMYPKNKNHLKYFMKEYPKNNILNEKLRELHNICCENVSFRNTILKSIKKIESLFFSYFENKKNIKLELLTLNFNLSNLKIKLYDIEKIIKIIDEDNILKKLNSEKILRSYLYELEFYCQPMIERIPNDISILDISESRKHNINVLNLFLGLSSVVIENITLDLNKLKDNLKEIFQLRFSGNLNVNIYDIISKEVKIIKNKYNIHLLDILLDDILNFEESISDNIEIQNPDDISDLIYSIYGSEYKLNVLLKKYNVEHLVDLSKKIEYDNIDELILSDISIYDKIEESQMYTVKLEFPDVFFYENIGNNYKLINCLDNLSIPITEKSNENEYNLHLLVNTIKSDIKLIIFSNKYKKYSWVNIPLDVNEIYNIRDEIPLYIYDDFISFVKRFYHKLSVDVKQICKFIKFTF